MHFSMIGIILISVLGFFGMLIKSCTDTVSEAAYLTRKTIADITAGNLPKSPNCQNGETGSMYDGSSNSYPTICLNSSFWMAKNMADARGTFYYPDNNEANMELHGLLYDLDAARNICPAGWHLPTNREFDQIRDYINRDNNVLTLEVPLAGGYYYSVRCVKDTK